MAMKVFINKKGIFFTFAAIILSAILIIGFKTIDAPELTGRTEVVEARIITMNNFIKDVEQDLEKGLRIASFRAFASMNQHIANNGTFISDVDQGFRDLVLDGTIENQQPSLMQDSTFTDWANKIRTQAQNLDINVNFTIINVDINQTDPWTIEIVSSVNLTVNDTKQTSSWKRSRTIVAYVPILDFEDPLYVVHSTGKVSNTVVIAPTRTFVEGNDVTNLATHANFSYYIESPSAPNYLKRLEGDLTNSSTGIESLINLGEFEDQGLTLLDRSIVDYIYFGNDSTTNHRINGTEIWFKLDDDHLPTYQAENVTI